MANTTAPTLASPVEGTDLSALSNHQRITMVREDHFVCGTVSLVGTTLELVDVSHGSFDKVGGELVAKNKSSLTTRSLADIDYLFSIGYRIGSGKS